MSSDEFSDLSDGLDRFRHVRSERLKNMPHPLPRLQGDVDSRQARLLFQPAGIIEEDFFSPHLDESGWKVVHIPKEGGNVRVIQRVSVGVNFDQPVFVVEA